MQLNLCLHLPQLSKSYPVTTCKCAATEWLKASVQIQMSNLFVFVWRGPFLSGITRSICETQSEELFICLGCNSALLCSCPSPQQSLASPHCTVTDRRRPLTMASMHGSRALICGGSNLYSVALNQSTLEQEDVGLRLSLKVHHIRKYHPDKTAHFC